MDDRFLPLNLHWTFADTFEAVDPHLRKLSSYDVVYKSDILTKLPSEIPGVYTLGGARQIGKTTLLKQWILTLLESGVSSHQILFLTGELIDNHQQLIQVIQDYISGLPDGFNKTYIIIDEITYIKNWDQGIKFLADLGVFESAIVLLTGSDLTMIQQARMRFPGRRGNADIVDFHYYPISFHDYVKTVHNQDLIIGSDLSEYFDQYLIHGGFLTAINDMIANQRISLATMRTYSDWIRGDIIKSGKSEAYLKEILMAILKTYGSQISWNALADHTSISHPHTVQQYCELLESMDVLFIQSALMEDKLIGAPKKAKKLIFKDPFIFHSINHWLTGNLPELKSDYTPYLAENAVVNHYNREYDCFYIKSEGEVDLAFIKEGTFLPVEIKWTTQMRPKDLKQISKYKNGLILTRTETKSTINGIPTEHLPTHLYNFSGS